MTDLARSSRSRTITRIVLAAALVVAPSAARGSVPDLDVRWLPWLGCWAPSGATEDAASAITGVQRVCVMPASAGSGVDIVNVSDGRIISRVNIDATGQRRPVNREGCSGWESARWSGDAERVFLRSELTCSGSITRASSGIIAVATPSDWVDVEVVAVGDQRSTRILRYRSAPDTTALAREIAAAIRDRELARQAARLAAASSPTIADVIEASREADASVVQAWLLQRMPRFSIDARGLTKLADARVPDSVIDLVVALASPERFADRLSARGYTFMRIDAPRPVTVAVEAQSTTEQVFETQPPLVGVYGAGEEEASYTHRHYDGCGHYGVTYMGGYVFAPYGFYSYWPYVGNQYDRYGNRYRNGYGDGYGYYPYTPRDPYRPVPAQPSTGRGPTRVIDLPQRRPVVTAPAPEPDPVPQPEGGRVVNGRGYTRPSDDAATGRAPVATQVTQPDPPRRSSPTPEPVPTRSATPTSDPAPTRKSSPPPSGATQPQPAPAEPKAPAAEPPPRTAKRRPPPTV